MTNVKNEVCKNCYNGSGCIDDLKAMEIASRFSDETLREIAYKVALEAMRWKDETMNAYITEAVAKKLKAIDKQRKNN